MTDTNTILGARIHLRGNLRGTIFGGRPQTSNRAISICSRDSRSKRLWGQPKIWPSPREIGRKVHAAPPLSLPLPADTQFARATVANVIPESAERFPAVCIIPAGLYTCLRPSHTDIYNLESTRSRVRTECMEEFPSLSTISRNIHLEKYRK